MDFLDRLTAVDLLHIDDLGAEFRTEWVLEQLYSIVNARYEAQRAIVATTNLSVADALAEHLGARTVSRLVEICGVPIPLYGMDRRWEAPARAPRAERARAPGRDRTSGPRLLRRHACRGHSWRPVGR